MVRRMKATITQIESEVTPSGNAGHIIVPKDWIGKEAIVKLKEKILRNYFPMFLAASRLID